MTTALRWLLLRGWSGTGHKMINHHCLSCHHVFTSIGFDFRGVNRFGNYFLDFLSGSLGFNRGLRMNRGFRLNELMCLFSAVLRHTFDRLIPYQCKLVRTGVPWTTVASLAYCESWRKEV